MLVSLLFGYCYVIQWITHDGEVQVEYRPFCHSYWRFLSSLCCAQPSPKISHNLWKASILIPLCVRSLACGYNWKRTYSSLWYSAIFMKQPFYAFMLFLRQSWTFAHRVLWITSTIPCIFFSKCVIISPIFHQYCHQMGIIQFFRMLILFRIPPCSCGGISVGDRLPSVQCFLILKWKDCQYYLGIWL